MSGTRRQFLRGALAGAALVALRAPLAAARGALRESQLAAVVGRALAAAKAAGASYADVRVVRRRGERLDVQDDAVAQVAFGEELGLGVRVLAGGAWGFAAAPRVSPAEAAKLARRAVEVARAHASARRRPVELAPEAAHVGAWRTPLAVHPFEVPLEDKAALLLEASARARSVRGARFFRASLETLAEWKLLASSQGAYLEQELVRLDPFVEVMALDEASGVLASRRHELAPRQAGWEYVRDSSLIAEVPRLAEEAVEKSRAPQVTPGRRDLVIDPSNLWLTIHETIGHATELDRALGQEANFAGTSYATPEQRGVLRVASPLVTFVADKTTPGGLATCGYDDEGVPAQAWELVRDGVLVGFQTTREQAGLLGEARSRGAAYADSYRSMPLQRMPNVSLSPGPQERSLEDLIAATERGLLVIGDGSWSIDQQRRSFQFGGQLFWEIEGGRRVRMVRDAGYASSTLAFWNACDLIGGASSWRLGGSLRCGKGEPLQLSPMSHGAPPVRVRDIEVVVAGKGGR